MLIYFEKARFGVLFRSSLYHLLDRKVGGGDEIISRQLVLVDYTEAQRKISLVLHDLEDHLLVVDWIQVMADAFRP